MEGKPYSRNTMKAIRSGLVIWFPSKEAVFHYLGLNVFKPANEAPDASLKDLARQGLISSTKHKRPISSKDLEALYAANQLGLYTPESKYAMVLRHSLLAGSVKYYVLSEKATKKSFRRSQLGGQESICNYNA